MSFTAGVYYGGEMRMNNYSLTLRMTTNSTDAVSHNVAFERIKYFVYDKMDSTIFVNSQHTEQCQQFLNCGLSITTLPGEPVDQLIGLMLYCKLNAIIEDRIIVDETEISSVLGENIVYMHSENENTDVETIPDWWYSPDCTHSEYILAPADKIVSMQSTSVWRELDLLWGESPVTEETGNIVVFADFKPVDDAK
jgi:hypothetical protein